MEQILLLLPQVEIDPVMKNLDGSLMTGLWDATYAVIVPSTEPLDFQWFSRLGRAIIFLDADLEHRYLEAAEQCTAALKMQRVDADLYHVTVTKAPPNQMTGLHEWTWAEFETWLHESL